MLLSDLAIYCLVCAQRYLTRIRYYLYDLCCHGLSIKRGYITDDDLYNFANSMLDTPNVFWSLGTQEAARAVVTGISSLELFRQEIECLTNYEISILRKVANNYTIRFVP